jgi:hypothetical protein
MSKKIYIDAFYDQYEDFLQQMQQVFPEDPDWPLYIAGLAIFRRTNPLVVVKKTWHHLSPYVEQIKNRDEQFFLNHDYSKHIDDEEPMEQTIAKLRGMWLQLSQHNKNIICDYVTNILYLAKRCSE